MAALPPKKRSNSRLLAPAALVLAALAVIVVLASSLGGGDGGGDSGSSGVPASDRLGETTARTTARTTPAKPKPSTYTVKTGDSLGSIAAKNDLTIQQLQELNPEADPQSLVAGQKIKLTE